MRERPLACATAQGDRSCVCVLGATRILPTEQHLTTSPNNYHRSEEPRLLPQTQPPSSSGNSSRLSQTSSNTGHGRRILLLAKLSSATMRLLPFLLAFTTSVLAYPQISSPAAGSSIPAGTITVKWTDNGEAPSISQLQTYTMTLFAGGNNAGVDSVSTTVIGLGLSKARWSMSAGG